MKGDGNFKDTVTQDLYTQGKKVFFNGAVSHYVADLQNLCSLMFYLQIFVIP